MLMRDSVQKYNPNLIPTGAANCSWVVQSKFKQIIFNPILIPTGGDALILQILYTSIETLGDFQNLLHV